MSDAMVTARMSAEKKMQANEILDKMGLKPSQVINELYDFVIQEHALPFNEKQPERGQYSAEEIAKAQSWVQDIQSLFADNEYFEKSEDELRQKRLIERGLASSEDFS